MAKVVRMPQQTMPAQMMPPMPAQQWWGGGGGWDGNPCCPPDGNSVPPFPCPGPGWPPPGCPPWYSAVNSPPWYPGANAGVSFGATAPPNPVRGHFWWDGATLWMFDGAAWVATGGEAGAAGTPPSANPPANPVPGTQWFNGTTLYVWDGNAWVPVSQTKSTISSTAPPAPNPGDTWWDGSQMRIWDGSAWQIVGPGATVGPVPTTKQVFAITQPTAYTIAAQQAILPFTTTPTIDTEGAWNGTTFKYTPNKTGMYSASCRVYGISTAAYDWFSATIVKNDSGTAPANTDQIVAIGEILDPSSGEGSWVSASGMVSMNGTTDFLRLWVGAAHPNFQGTGGNPVFQIFLLP